MTGAGDGRRVQAVGDTRDAAGASGSGPCTRGDVDIARGEHLSRFLGCRSCHGNALTGVSQIDDPTIGRLFSSNLTRAVPSYDDAALERVIRTGVRPDGSHLWMMAAAPYALLTRADMRALVGYLRGVPPTGEAHPRLVVGARFLKAAMARRVQPKA